jgi:phosphoglucomutase
MNPMDTYQRWMSYSQHPQAIADELSSIMGNDAAITDRFYQDLAFGTGGLRGVLGAGTNRMNVYTIRRATLGFARYISALGTSAKEQGVVVAYDCRRMSREFALETGLVLAAAGVRAYVFDHLCPTPELSFAVRSLGAAGGIMITASHNPPEYNGYKVYDAYGGQVLTDAAKQIMTEIHDIDDMFTISVAGQQDAEQREMLRWLGQDMDDSYCREVVSNLCVPSLTDQARETLHVVYTPLHGTGNVPVRRVLQEAGYTQVSIVESQASPDGEFPTVKSPNPEEPAAFELALELAQRVKADIAMGTDPDADRVGIAVRARDGSYRLLTGNQVGGLLVDFVLRQRKAAGTLPKDGIVFKTVVTSELGAEVARSFGIAVEDTLTGFKYIGDRIQHYEDAGQGTFLFGYEESYGYLAADFVRDKDAVQICLLVAEMAAHYKSLGTTLLDALQRVYEQVGYFQEELVSATLPGRDGVVHMQRIMANLRSGGMQADGLALVAVEDYELRERRWVGKPAPGDSAREHTSEPIALPKADVLKYVFEGGSWLAVRPSGTEPKIKFYLGARGNSAQSCEGTLQKMRATVQSLLN